jgi:hypothetical protein
MLIVQIALGIVLAVLVLAFLPQLLSISIWLGLAALVLGLIAVAFFFFLDNPIIVVLLVAFAVVGYFVIKMDSKDGNEEERKRRKNLGYDD